MLIHNLGSSNNPKENWKEKFKQDYHLPKYNTYSSPNETSTSNSAWSPSTNNTSRPPRISLSKNKSDLFKVIHIKISTFSIECKKAYKKLARHYHPDKWKGINTFPN